LSASLLERLGLHRPELRAWAMYDWANSAFITTVITAIYPVYYQKVAAAGLPQSVATSRHALTTSIALLAIAVLSPILGAVADFAAIKKRLLTAFLGVGVVSTAALFLVGEGDWLLGSVLFALGNVGVLVSLTMYDSLLPHIASASEIDRVSTAGYALGYVGGGILLAVNVLMIEKHEMFGIADKGLATRLCFVTVAIWWALFALPLLLRVSEPPRRLEADERGDEHVLRVAFSRLAETFGELRGYRQAFLLLLAVLIYNDGITTIYRMATIYGAEIGLPSSSLIAAILMVQFVGIPFAFLFGALAGRFGARGAIFFGLAVYCVIAVFGYFIQSSWQFFLLAFGVATVQGGTQALSRSLFASMVPRHKSSEFFGFYGVAERFAAIFGPALFFAVTNATGSSRNAVLAVVLFFIVGGLLLSRVRVDEGRARARAVEREVHAADGAAG